MLQGIGYFEADEAGRQALTRKGEVGEKLAIRYMKRAMAQKGVTLLVTPRQCEKGRA